MDDLSVTTAQDEPRGLDIECENGHRQRIGLRGGYTKEIAEDYAAMLDGTSPFYVHDPREPRDQQTFIGHCQHDGCGALFRAIPYGFT